MEKLLTAAVITGYRPRKDRSVSITFETPEKDAAQIGALHGMIDTMGYLCFKPEKQLTHDEIKEIDELDTDMFDNPKTKSHRLRAVIWLNHQSEGSELDFKDYYAQKMEKLIEHFKGKLND
tara:strand:+ start:233 stop:595 length:363 start_codon:yes stop_codon:yes gene_type:complete